MILQECPGTRDCRSQSRIPSTKLSTVALHKFWIHAPLSALSEQLLFLHCSLGYIAAVLNCLWYHSHGPVPSMFRILNEGDRLFYYNCVCPVLSDVSLVTAFEAFVPLCQVVPPTSPKLSTGSLGLSFVLPALIAENELVVLLFEFTQK